LPIPPLPELIAAVEAVAALGRPDRQRPRVKAVALNTGHLDADAAARAISAVSADTDLPCADAVRGGAGQLLLNLLT
jgi:uncharacterized NAD-dependent epimerase/dehydratase family protein